MKFYLANPTPQKWIFRYRLPGIPQVSTLFLDKGEQKVINDLEPHEITALCKQAEDAGAVSSERSAGVRDKVTIVYSTDVPVKGNCILKRFESNYNAIASAGKEFMKSQIDAINKKTNIGHFSIEVNEEQISRNNDFMRNLRMN